MHRTGASLFDGDGDAVVPTEHARGPWDPRSCHGGPISALLVRAVERVENDTSRWQIARATVELLRPVPVREPLRVEATVERPGRLVSLVSVRASGPEGGEVARAVALRVRREGVPLPEEHEAEPVFSPPGGGTSGVPAWAVADTAFHKDSVELRFVEGNFVDRGPVAMWGRLVVPLFAGEEPSGAQRAAAIADFANGVSAELDADQVMFVNPDLTLHLLRPPVGEWIGMRSRSYYGDEGAGMSDSELYDARGRVGRSAQSLLLNPR